MKLNHSILAVSLLGMIGTSQAATIAWSGSTWVNTGGFKQTMGVDQIDQSGEPGETELFLAVSNASGNRLTSTDPAIPFTTSSPNLDISALDSTLNGTYPNQFIGNDPFVSTTTGPKTLTLSGLELGFTYRIQAVVVDTRSTSNGNTVAFDGTNVGQYANSIANVTFGDSLLATGTFVADATTQDFTVEAFDDDGTTSLGGYVNAIVVFQTAVPEPSSTALIGLGGLALILRRRK